MMRLLIVLALLVAPLVMAQTSVVESTRQSGAADDEPIPSGGEDDQSADPMQDPSLSLPLPSVFEPFTPDEDIEDDLSVSYPVDI